jgi:hypothetical protein
MQIVLLAAAHPERPWEALVSQLLAQLATMPPRGGEPTYVAVFLR